MPRTNLHDLCDYGAEHFGDAIAVRSKQGSLSYSELQDLVSRTATGIRSLIMPGDRVAIYLPKLLETVVLSLAVSRAGGVLVPINPVLKAPQVRHILADAGASVLISQNGRLKALADVLPSLGALQYIVCVDACDFRSGHALFSWDELRRSPPSEAVPKDRESLSTILYTSGSTGMPKGVMLSHNNLLLGAQSVAEYLELASSDKVLAALPLSFDYGYNQLLSSLWVGAECVLLDYLLPRDIPLACQRYAITGLAGLPPLWAQLSELEWPQQIQLRYFTNSGGHMSPELLAKMRKLLPNAAPYLMYGLTEAFRSSYLPPSLVDSKPNSIGKAIPNAELYVINDALELCAPGELGELVHAGGLVAKGYWHLPEQTAARFKPLPESIDPRAPMAVWSGDQVVLDDDGFLYFRGRKDHQIKVSGYRVSPEEIEAYIASFGCVKEALAVGVPNGVSGHAVAVVVVPGTGEDFDIVMFQQLCRQRMPAYMQPAKIELRDQLPRNANGKIDRDSVISAIIDATGPLC